MYGPKRPPPHLRRRHPHRPNPSRAVSLSVARKQHGASPSSSSEEFGVRRRKGPGIEGGRGGGGGGGGGGILRSVGIGGGGIAWHDIQRHHRLEVMQEVDQEDVRLLNKWKPFPHSELEPRPPVVSSRTIHAPQR